MKQREIELSVEIGHVSSLETLPQLRPSSSLSLSLSYSSNSLFFLGFVVCWRRIENTDSINTHSHVSFLSGPTHTLPQPLGLGPSSSALTSQPPFTVPHTFPHALLFHLLPHALHVSYSNEQLSPRSTLRVLPGQTSKKYIPSFLLIFDTNLTTLLNNHSLHQIISNIQFYLFITFIEFNVILFYYISFFQYLSSTLHPKYTVGWLIKCIIKLYFKICNIFSLFT